MQNRKYPINFNAHRKHRKKSMRSSENYSDIYHVVEKDFQKKMFLLQGPHNPARVN